MPKLLSRKLQLFQNGKYFSHDFQSKYNVLLMLCTSQETNTFLITVHLKKKLMCLPSAFISFLLTMYLSALTRIYADLWIYYQSL